MQPSTPQAAEHYRRAEHHWSEGRHSDALAELLHTIATDGSYPNAKNFAGSILTTLHAHEPGAMTLGVALLEQARELAPREAGPLQNLLEAYLASDQTSRAIELVDRVVASQPDWGAGLNLAGWLYAVRLAAHRSKGIELLRRAIALDGGNGDAHVNLGRAYLLRGDERLALDEMQAALSCERLSDRVSCLVQVAKLQERKGNLRRALRGLRRARSQWAAGSGSSFEEISASVARCENALRAVGAYFPHESDEAAMGELLERSDAQVRALRKFAKRVEMALRERHKPSDEATRRNVQRLEVMRSTALSHRFDPCHAGIQTDLEPEPSSKGYEDDATMLAIRAEWPPIQAVFYLALIEKEEPLDRSPHARELCIDQWMGGGRYEEAMGMIEQIGMEEDEDLLHGAEISEVYADLARKQGREEHATRLYAGALRRFELYASRAMRNEAAARAIAVDRVRSKIGDRNSGKR